jgi:hypothetical protein
MRHLHFKYTPLAARGCRASFVGVRLLLWLLLLAACDNGPLMTPGQDCQPCHKRFTVSGTVFRHVDSLAADGLEGASVVITDRDGKSLSLDTNAAGNFYSEEPLHYPLQVEVHDGDVVRKMAPLVESRGCNACHQVPPTSGAAGRIVVQP